MGNRDPHPHPLHGKEFRIYGHGLWVGEDGPWRKDLVFLLETIEYEIEQKKIEAEWYKKMTEIKKRRERAAMWDKVRAGYNV